MRRALVLSSGSEARSTKPPVVATNADMSPPYAFTRSPMPISPCPNPSFCAKPPGPSSRTSSRSWPGAYSTVTSARRPPECLRALVSPSCTMRYAERSSERGRATGSPVHVESYVEPRGAHVARQGLQVVQPGTRRELEQVVALPQRAQQPAHLGERRTAGLLDVPQRLALLGRRPASGAAPPRPGAPSRSPRGRRRRGARAPSGRAPRPPPPGPPTPAPARPAAPAPPRPRSARPRSRRAKPHEPGDGEERRGEDEVGRALGRVVVDDDGRADQHDHQPDPGLESATQTAQQHGGAHPAEEDRRLGGDQLAVEEAQRGAADPDGRRGQRTGSRLRASSARSTTLSAATSNHSCSTVRPVRVVAQHACRPRSPAAATTIRTSRPQAAKNRQTRPIGSTYGRRSPRASYESRTRCTQVSLGSRRRAGGRCR